MATITIGHYNVSTLNSTLQGFLPSIGLQSGDVMLAADTNTDDVASSRVQSNVSSSELSTNSFASHRANTTVRWTDDNSCILPK